jgi:hypothetical protein
MNFLAKAMLKKQLSQLPKDQADMMLKAVEEHPEIFEKMAKEIKEKVKNGVNKQNAAMSVMMAHQNELRNILMKQHNVKK